jgi:hypothetical protein
VKVLYQIEGHALLFNTLEECEESLRLSYAKLDGLQVECEEQHPLGVTLYFVHYSTNGTPRPRIMYRVTALRVAEGAEQLHKD